MIVVLLLSIVTLSYLIYLKDRKQHDLLSKKVQETQKILDQLHMSLVQGELKKAFTELAQAQKNVSDLLPSVTEPSPTKPVIAQKQPPPPIPPSSIPVSKPPTEAPVQPLPGTAPPKPPPSVIPAGLTMAADESPYPFVLAEAGEYLLICEKDQKTLHLFRNTNNRFLLVKSYACIVGANGLDKTKTGDLATPVGNYFSLRYIPGKSLPEKYGYGAFVLNYPNFLDRRARKDGTGIWLHGHTPGKNLGEQDLQSTSGCIAVSNDVLKELTGMLKVSGAPVVVVNRLRLAKVSSQQQLSEEVIAFMKSWGKAWESGKTEPFMSHYASDFINGDGMNYQAFKRQKEKVNRGKKFIRVKIENPAILLPQEKGGQIAVVRFTQRYHSNNFQSDSRKLFYLKKGQAGWQIIGESRI
ncbi:MAG: L,D-transpeptidase family protein [Syntrophales bacterium]|nr:L,D-transpeptidase family protein [Syntrophales bacterium]